MSMNIHITSEGNIITPSGKTVPYYRSFECLQTPTKITDQIMASFNPRQKYIDWVKFKEIIEIVDDYDIDEWDDETDYYKVIGNHEYSFAREHIDELNKFIEEEEEKGFVIRYYSM